jgi:serine/threonine protein kinase
MVDAISGQQVTPGRGQELVLGPYRLIARLGAGGMGEVFKARHVRMDRLVALKIIHKQQLASSTAVERFRREARAAAQLAHPNIVIAYDADEVGDTHFLAMEYVEGTDLAAQVKKSSALPIVKACQFIRQAALGLQHAHLIAIKLDYCPRRGREHPALHGQDPGHRAGANPVRPGEP